VLALPKRFETMFGLRAVLTALTICFCALPARAQEHRVCIDFDIPSGDLVVVRLGYYPSVADRAYADWFDRHKDKHWLLRVMRASMGYATKPDEKVVAFRTLSMDLNLQAGAFVPSVALWRQFSPPDGGPPEPVPADRCRQYATVTKESLYASRAVVQVLDGAFGLSRKVAPTRSTGSCVDDGSGRHAKRLPELDFDGFEACDFTASTGNLSALDHIAFHRKPDPDPIIMRCDKRFYCNLEFKLDGWPLQVGFMQDRRASWRLFKQAAVDYLNQKTLSRTLAATE
jgi:hypothetical protein